MAAGADSPSVLDQPVNPYDLTKSGCFRPLLLTDGPIFPF